MAESVRMIPAICGPRSGLAGCALGAAAAGTDACTCWVPTAAVVGALRSGWHRGARGASGRLADGRIQTSVSFLPLVFAAVAFGPLAAFVVGADLTAVDIRRPYLRWVVYTPVRALTGAAAGLAASRSRGTTSALWAICSRVLVGSLTNLASRRALQLRDARCAKAAMRGLCASNGSARSRVVPLYVPLVALFVYGYHAYSLWVVVAFFVPALASSESIHLYQEAARRDAPSRGRKRATWRCEPVLCNSACCDSRRAGPLHGWPLGRRRDLRPRHCCADGAEARTKSELAHLCGLVHDVGKIGLPAGLLEKPGALVA